MGLSSNDMGKQNTQAQISHALNKLTELTARLDVPEAPWERDLFQLGYNAGRLAELTGSGRYVWDTLKDAVELGRWKVISLQVLIWTHEFEADIPIGSSEA